MKILKLSLPLLFLAVGAWAQCGTYGKLVFNPISGAMDCTGNGTASGAPPTGTAGGSLAGTYPNPTIATLGQDLLFADATYDIGKSLATRPRDLFLSRNAVIGGTANISAGAAATPSLNFVGFLTTGLWAQTNNLMFSVNGVSLASLRNDGVFQSTYFSSTNGVFLNGTGGAQISASGSGSSSTATFNGSVAATNATLSGTLNLAQQTPASAGAACVANQFAFDTGFVYVCTATNIWKRVAIATW